MGEAALTDQILDQELQYNCFRFVMYVLLASEATIHLTMVCTARFSIQMQAMHFC
jgi:hypothetical protein